MCFAASNQRVERGPRPPVQAPSLLCRSPQDHMKISFDLKGFVRGLDQPMPTFRRPAEQQRCHAVHPVAAVGTMSAS